MSSALASGFFTSRATWEAPYGMSKRILSVKCTAINAYLKKQTKNKTHINNLNLHLKKLEKNIKLKVSRSNKITKIRVEK